MKNIVVGGRVRVKPRSFLEQFQRESKYQHPISNEQLEAAGTTDTVKGAGIHRDGYALLELTAIPGIWHEECLEWVEQGNWLKIAWLLKNSTFQKSEQIWGIGNVQATRENRL